MACIVIDKDPEQVKKRSPFVSKAMVADITKRQALLEAGIDTVDVAVIATTEPFESSVLAAHHLKELTVPLVVAKAADEDQAQILGLMGVARTFTPEMESAIGAAYMIPYPRNTSSPPGTNFCSTAPRPGCLTLKRSNNETLRNRQNLKTAAFGYRLLFFDPLHVDLSSARHAGLRCDIQSCCR